MTFGPDYKTLHSVKMLLYQNIDSSKPKDGITQPPPRRPESATRAQLVRNTIDNRRKKETSHVTIAKTPQSVLDMLKSLEKKKEKKYKVKPIKLKTASKIINQERENQMAKIAAIKPAQLLTREEMLSGLGSMSLKA